MCVPGVFSEENHFFPKLEKEGIDEADAISQGQMLFLLYACKLQN